jgi:hypothetical protein
MGDGWGSEESQVNQIGIYIVAGGAIIAALLLWGVIPVAVPVSVLAAAVAVCGLVGGAINVLGRGPVAAGAVVGVVMALGGFCAVYFWINGRESVRWFEVMIAFVIGIVPGFVVQYLIQRMLGVRAEAGA